MEKYADLAFSAEAMPVFGYGCAVFLQSDIVNFQRQGWRAEEILAGLAAVLPKNIFQYVANVPNVAKLGTRFILQGGTQKNLAVVKAETDFIRASFRELRAPAPRSSFMSIAQKRAPSGPRWKPCACGRVAAARLSLDWMQFAESPITPRATKRRAATSVRTIVSALSWMSRPAARRKRTSRRSSPTCLYGPASNA